MTVQLGNKVLTLHYNNIITLEVYDRIMIFQLRNTVLTKHYNSMVT